MVCSRSVRLFGTGLGAALLILLAMEGLARGVSYYYGFFLHPLFVTKEKGPTELFSMVNETGALGFLQSPRDKMRVMVIGGSAAFNGGFDYGWPSLLTRTMANGHLDNFSETGPSFFHQITIMEDLVAAGRHYDLLLFEPPIRPLEKEEPLVNFRGPWSRTPWKVGRVYIFFPGLLTRHFIDLLRLDPVLLRLGLIRRENSSQKELLDEFVAVHGPVTYRDDPDFFSKEQAAVYEQKVDAVIKLAKRVAGKVAVIAPILHYHAAADGTDQQNFYWLLRTGHGNDFLSLKSLAEEVWAENRILEKLAAQNKVAFYDGNPYFAHRPDHAKLFFDQYHLYQEGQEPIANGVIKALKIGDERLKVQVREGIYLGP